MDNKEKFIALWEEAGGERAEKGILKKIAKKLKVPEGTIRRWKSEHIKKNKVNVRRTNAKNERSGKEYKRNSVNNEDQKEILKVIDKNNNIIYQDKKDNILFSDNYIYNESEIFYSKEALIKASNLAIRQIVARLILDMKKN